MISCFTCGRWVLIEAASRGMTVGGAGVGCLKRVLVEGASRRC